jgi:hypothetical protein
MKREKPKNRKITNRHGHRAVARTEMGGFWTNRFVENGF